MNHLNYLYAIILGIVLAHWFYRLAIQNMGEPGLGVRVCVYLGMALCGLMASLPLLTWISTPDLALGTWWKSVIPADQMPSRVFFWVMTVVITVVIMTGVMVSDGWGSFIDTCDTESSGVILLGIGLFLGVSTILSYSFNITLFANLMRLA